MRFLLVVLFATAPFFAIADPIVEAHPDNAPTIKVECDAGSVAFPTKGAIYELVATGDAFLCEAAACASGGDARVKGNHGLFFVRGGTVMSCRTDGLPSEVHFIPVKVVK